MSAEQILVLTMGRVGSSSIYYAVRDVTEAPLHHVHSVNLDTLDRQVEKAGSWENAARSVKDGRKARKALDVAESKKIITLVRDPIARNLSAAFVSLRRRLGLEGLNEFLSDSGRVEQFWMQFYDQRPFQWFDREMRDVFDVDVYSYTFPDEGFRTYTKGDVELLVLRAELNDAQKGRALERFLGREGVSLGWANSSSNGEAQAELYEKLARSAGFDEDYVGRVWESQYMRHFYRAVAKEEYIERWAYRS